MSHDLWADTCIHLQHPGPRGAPVTAQTLEEWDGTHFQNNSVYFWAILILGNVVFYFNYSQCLRLNLTLWIISPT